MTTSDSPSGRHAPRALRAFVLTAAIASISLAACGGGGNGAPSDSAPQSFTHVHRYGGHGNTAVGTVEVPRFAEIFWHTDGGAIHITSSPPLQIDSGGAANGAATVATGSYANVHVATRGNWSIEVRW